MSTRITFSAALLAGTVLAGSAWAATINVGAGESIQSAVDRAGAGDTVVVAPGTYSPFQINRDGITVKSSVPGGAHVVAKGSNQPAIASYGQNNIAVLDFRLSSLNGDGVKIGGNASRDAQDIQFSGNTVETAAKDGLKFFQIKGLRLTSNTLKVAGTARNGNGDGGIDFVGVDNSAVQANRVERTYGHACLMMKGGSSGNTVSGNSFRGCERDGVTIGGFTDANLMDSSDRGLEAHNNSITGNEIQAGSGKCPIYTHKAANNTVRGNELMGGGGGCSNAGGGALVELAGIGAGGSSSLSPSTSYGTDWLETAVQNMASRGLSPEQIKAQFENQGITLTSEMINALITGTVGANLGLQGAIADALRGYGGGSLTGIQDYLINQGWLQAEDLLREFVPDLSGYLGGFTGGNWGCNMKAALASVAGVAGSAVNGLFTGGRSTVWAQITQIFTEYQKAMCDEERARLQARVVQGMTTNPAEKSPEIIWQTTAPMKAYDAGKMSQDYIAASRKPMTAKESAAAMEAIRSRSDAASVYAAQQAVENAKRQQELATIASQSMGAVMAAPGPTAATQGLAGIVVTQMAQQSAQAATDSAFAVRALEAQEEQRAGERMGMMRRDRLYRSEAGEAPQPFKLFQ
jgi:hypothetical protein